MGTELTIEYQEDADILVIAKYPSYIGQDEDEIDDLVCARTNPATDEIEYVEIVFFKARLKKADKVLLPIDATLMTVDARVPFEPARPCSDDKNLTIRYNQTNDTLTLEQSPSYTGQNTAEICEGVSARLNAETGEIENLEIRRFTTRMEQEGVVVLPIDTTLRLSKSAVSAD